jgi:hypothetical protein
VARLRRPGAAGLQCPADQGRPLIFANDRRDLPLIFALANLGADLLYAYLNPRLRLG